MDMAWPERRAAYPHKHRDDVGGTRGDLGHGDLTKVGTLGNFGELCSFHSKLDVFFRFDLDDLDDFTCF